MQPIDFAVYENGSEILPLTVKAETSDAGILSYQWYMSSDEGDIIIENAVSAEYVPEQSGTYFVVITNSDGTQESLTNSVKSTYSVIVISTQTSGINEILTSTICTKTENGYLFTVTTEKAYNNNAIIAVYDKSERLITTKVVYLSEEEQAVAEIPAYNNIGNVCVFVWNEFLMPLGYKENVNIGE